MLKEQPTWKIMDASKLQAFMNCPRSFFFEYILGWRGDEPNVHLEHGSAIHKAMECFYIPEKAPDFSDDAVAKACVAYLEYYREYFGADIDDANAPKNPECTFRALRMYRDQYKHEDNNLEILYVEVAGSILLTMEKVLHFRQDIIARDPKSNEIFSLEHKTGSNFSRVWANQWMQKIQTGVYTHVLYTLFPEDDIYGVKINGIFIRRPPKLKQNGEPYAGARDCEFHRVPVGRTYKQLLDWYETINFWYDFQERELEKLMESKEEDELLKAYPKNTESCTHWFGCPYSDYCFAWANPLQKCERPPLGFVVDHWDPRTKPAQKILELT